MLIRFLTLTVAALIIASCSVSGTDESSKKTAFDIPIARTGLDSSPGQPKQEDLDEEQVARGEKLFNEKCVECHKKFAQGEPYWQEKDDKGNLPPPPLDGTAHAWHHPAEVLHKFIKKGGTEYGGTMEAFEDKLTDSQIDDIIVWVTSLWPKDVYDKWYRRDKMTRDWKK